MRAQGVAVTARKSKCAETASLYLPSQARAHDHVHCSMQDWQLARFAPHLPIKKTSRACLNGRIAAATVDVAMSMAATGSCAWQGWL